MSYDTSRVRNPYITWAIVNNKVEWIEGKVDDREWLKNKFNIGQREYEDIIRGYIKNHNNGKIEIGYYKGSGFDICDIDTKLLAVVTLIADLSFNFDQIVIYTGIKIRKSAEKSKPNDAYKILTKPDIHDKVVSLKQILDYEDKIAGLINSSVHSSAELYNDELKLCHYMLNNYLNSERKLLNYDFKRRIITYSVIL